VRAAAALAVVIVTCAAATACSGGAPSRSAAPAGWNFVTRSGSSLQLNGRTFRFSGANIYWGGLDENGRTAVNYPTSYRVQTALATTAGLGETVVRCETCGTSTGSPLTVEPALNVFNQTALRHIDYFVAQAQKYGIRLDVPLTNNWDYYLGGYRDFVQWLGLATPADCPTQACANIFYTNPKVVAAFEKYISVLLNHVNVYTGVPNKDNPTILCWETGNEMPPSTGGQPALTKWTATIAAYIKSIAPRQLVMDGAFNFDPGNLAVPDVDIESPHVYPLNPAAISSMNTVAARAAAAGKATVVGEYQWDNPAQLPAFLTGIERNPGISGDIFWHLMPQNDLFGWTQHFDGYQLHFPGGKTTVAGTQAHGPVLAASSNAPQVAELRKHAYAMAGRGVPPYAVPAAPVITNVEHIAEPALGDGNLVEWRGSAGAARYVVRRSVSGPHGRWTTVCTACADPEGEPFLDQGAGSGPDLWYQVTPVNPGGVAGPPSAAFQVTDQTLDENMNGLQLAGGASVVRQAPGLRTAEAVASFAPAASSDAGGLQFLVSANGTAWTAVPGSDVQLNWGWVTAAQDRVPFIYTVGNVQGILRGASYVEVRWSGGTSYSPRLSTLRITFATLPSATP
jgi:mannan endo-1,4-beta-mannosidase